MKTSIPISKQSIHHLLKPPSTTHLRHISGAPDSPSQTNPSSPSSTPPMTGPISNPKSSLSPLNPSSKIARQFDSSSKALKFFHFINNPSPSPLPLPLSSLFETVVELAIREQGPIVDLFNLSKELKVSLTPYSAILLIKYFFRVKKVEESLLVYDELDPEVKNINVRNALLDVLLKSEKFDDAHKVFDEMLERNSRNSN